MTHAHHVHHRRVIAPADCASPKFSLEQNDRLPNLRRMVRLRAARVHEMDALTELCLRSKAVWGYDQAFMDACRKELTLTPRDVKDSKLQVAERDGLVVGVAQVSATDGVAHLDKLFVEPKLVRSGAGRTLFEWARNAAKDLGATTMMIEADPDAAAFYRRMGAVDDGVVPSGSIPGRLLPRLRLDLTTP